MDFHTLPTQPQSVTVTSRRRRTRQACEACKLRKRKCDGQQPCNSCIQYEYECSFTARRRAAVAQKQTTSRANSVGESPQPIPQLQGEDNLRMEANSGIHFPNILSLELNSVSNAKIQGFGWNLGSRYSCTSSAKSITDLVTEPQWENLLRTYNEKIHCVYGFLDIEKVLSQSSSRWRAPTSTNAYDHVLAGLAAIASLFCHHTHSVSGDLLVDCAKDVLESRSMIRDPTFEDVQAWVLRTLYLRLTHPPHAAWLASCTTMHIIETVGIHHEASCEGVSDECRRRTVWIAKLFNTWICWEYGRSRVVIRGDTCQPPSSKLHDGTTDMLKLFNISAVLDTDKDSDAASLEAALNETERQRFRHIPLVLSQTNLCFAIYRRLRTKNPRVRNGVATKVLSAGRRGLLASTEALQSNQPWWHVPNIPYQFICILLAMDTPESLSYISRSISTMRDIVNQFGTAITYKALVTVEQFVEMSRMRKEREVAILHTSTQEQHNVSNGYSGGTITASGSEACDAVWSEGILWDTPTLGGVDWEQLWTDQYDFGS